KSKYNMSVHNDYACFEVFDNVTTKKSDKGWIPLNFHTEENLPTARDAAMATGAFPLGLKPRMLERDAKHVVEIPWLRSYFKALDTVPTQKIKTLNVDGGMINNEPFEKVRELLDNITTSKHSIDKEELSQMNSNYNTSENTVLMV